MFHSLLTSRYKKTLTTLARFLVITEDGDLEELVCVWDIYNYIWGYESVYASVTKIRMRRAATSNDESLSIVYVYWFIWLNMQIYIKWLEEGKNEWMIKKISF